MHWYRYRYRPPFNNDLIWPWRSWPPKYAYLRKSKYVIDENGSCQVSNHRFFVVPISFWDLFMTSDDPGGRELQNLPTSGCQNMKAMKISLVRYQISVLIPFWVPSLTIYDSEGIWPPDINDLRRSKYEINKNSSCEESNLRFFGVPISFWVPVLTIDDSEGILPPNISDLCRWPHKRLHAKFQPSISMF